MAENVLTGLIPSLFKGLDTVSRELTGYIPAVFRDSSLDRAAVDQDVTYHVAPAANVGDTTPAMTVPEPTGQTIGPQTMTISKSRNAEFGFVGEDRLGLDNNGAGFSQVQADMFAQGVRALVNEIEFDLEEVARANVSRATGVVATEPFASNTAALTAAGKILSDNGAPMSDRQLVLDTQGGANLRTLYGINTDRDWSKSAVNDQGVLATPHGLSTRESGQGSAHTAGTSSSSTTDGTGYAVGSTTITLASAGTGTILADDVITFAGDTEQYVIVTGDTDTSDGGTIVLQEPGLRQAIPASATAITMIATHDNRGIAFYRNAIVLASRAPALPPGGDLAIDRRMFVDPRSGLAFEVSVYPGYRKTRFEVAMAWGVAVTQPRHTALILA